MGFFSFLRTASRSLELSVMLAVVSIIGEGSFMPDYTRYIELPDLDAASATTS